MNKFRTDLLKRADRYSFLSALADGDTAGDTPIVLPSIMNTDAVSPCSRPVPVLNDRGQEPIIYRGHAPQAVDYPGVFNTDVRDRKVTDGDDA